MDFSNNLEQDTGYYKKEEKDAMIKREVKRLKKIFRSMDNEKMDIVESLIQNAAFLTVTLYDLQQNLIKKGLIIPYQNGKNQFGYKKNPEVDIFNTMSRNHASIIKQLTELLPKNTNPSDTSDEDELLDFINRRDDADAD